MLWSRRHLLWAGGAASLAACGYAPVYGPGGTGGILDGAVRLTTPKTVEGFTLRQQLEDRFGPPSTPRFELVVGLRTSEERAGVTTDQSTTRYNVLGTANFTLKSLDGGAVLAADAVRSFTSYSATGTPLATRAAQKDAYARLMVILADGIVSRLLLTRPGSEGGA